MKHLGDITKIKGDQIEPVDVIIGGSPCQDLSVAGKRAGLDGARSGLFMEQIRIIKEMRNSERSTRANQFIKPRYMVWENVCGAFSSNKGEDFRIVLEETAKVADENAVIPKPPKGKWQPAGSILGNGWSIAWRVHDAQFWGVPQRRKRIALVADFGGHTAPKILFECEGVSRDPEPGGTAGKETAGNIRKNTTQTGIVGIYDVRVTSPGTKNARANCYETNISRTLDTQPINPNSNEGGVLIIENESYGLDRASFNQGKNAKYNFSVEKEISPPIVAKGPGGCLQQMQGCNYDGTQISPTLTSRNAGGSQRMPDKENFNCVLCARDYKGIGGQDDNKIVPQVVGSLCARDYKGYVVRRLTPLECERLQGYPDGWTDIGDWVDSKGKKHKGESDAPRYKALGNSIALPFWEWMLNRMSEHLPEDATMGSLFDGIGGFPLIGTRVGINPVWASEIEEFCIAVTKKHFGEE